jgi:hypothetical protein
VLVTVEDEVVVVVVVVVEPLCAAGVELHALANSPRQKGRTVAHRFMLGPRLGAASASRRRSGIAARHKGIFGSLTYFHPICNPSSSDREFSQVEPLSQAADRKPDRVGG